MSTPIPKPKGLPILGNLFSLDGNNPWASFNKLALTNKDFRAYLPGIMQSLSMEMV